MVIAASKSELVKAEYELREGEFVQVSFTKAPWDGEIWSENLFNQDKE